MQSDQFDNKVIYSTSIHYNGNLLILILILAIFFPVGIFLALKNIYVDKKTHYVCLSYSGSWGWVFFWALLFFPIAIILMIFNKTQIIEVSADTYRNFIQKK